MEKILEQILNELKELKMRQQQLEGAFKTGQEHLEDQIDSLRRSIIKDLSPSIETDTPIEESDVKIQTRFERYSRTPLAEDTEKQYEEDLQTMEQISTTVEEDIQKDDGLSGITTDQKVTEHLSNPKNKELRNLVNTAVIEAQDLFPDRRITLEIRGELLFLEIEGKDEKDIKTLQKLLSISSPFEEFIIDLDFQ
ncbi:hypothetical protein RCG17_01485 [Neobacillus sp. PS3-12]|jgi:hypothetical protein|uniref:hypothetical protein n=1 Tax=Neobacillus sp. PS3-12 TaxID=3070677 RepID=UPI0027E125BE|nr:hypothetical protein [Neobacillus sp. PS3-12]WML53406.1 hypothetical protein RCG17_01485 [Neobacillus sp. PS3-12]